MGLFFSRTSRTRSRVRVRACPRTARSRVRVRVTVRARAARSRVRVRVCASYVFLPSFPWRASGSVHDGRRPLFSRVHVPPVHGSVYVCVPRTWFCPVFHGARPVPSTTGVGQFFPVSSYSPFTAPFKCFCLVINGARPHPSMKYVKHFFPVSLYSPFMGPCKCLCDELHT